jgi:hypothetical protein
MDDENNITPEHDVSPCSKKENYEDMRPSNLHCWKVEEHEGRLTNVEQKIEDLEKVVNELKKSRDQAA